MDIRQLKYFIEVANTNNLTKAAQNLYISQPTLSIAMKRMEKELNTQLFNKHYQLTDSGKYLYEHGSEIVAHFDDLVQTMRQRESDNKREALRLGMTILFAVQFMQEISQFIAKNPHVDLLITQNGSRKLQEMLANKELDVALVSLPNTQSDSINIENFQTSKRGYHVYVVMPESNPLSQSDSLTFLDLADESFSTLNQNFMLGKLLNERSQYYGYQPKIVFEHDDLQVLLYSIKDLNTVCLLPIEYQDISNMPGLVWIPLDDKYSFFQVGIATRKQQIISQTLQNFIDEIRN